jgi:hypothetical protein
MDGARRQLLAGPRFARDQHGAVGGGDAVEHRADLLHGRALPHQIVETRVLLEFPLEQGVLPLELAALQGVLEDDPHLLHVERLDDVVVGAEFQGLDGRFGGGVGGD